MRLFYLQNIKNWFTLFTIVFISTLASGCNAPTSKTYEQSAPIPSHQTPEKVLINMTPDSDLHTDTTTGSSQCSSIVPSPDGTYLACITSPVDQNRPIHLLDDQGNKIATIEYPSATDDDRSYTSMTWSPDSQSLLFNSYVGLPPGKDPETWIASIDEGWIPKRLLSLPYAAMGMKWAPDSSQIAFVDASGELFLLSPEGAKESLVNENVFGYPLGSNAIAWSPDGEEIAYSIRDEIGSPMAQVISLSTRNIRNLISGSTDRVLISSWLPNRDGLIVLDAQVVLSTSADNTIILYLLTPDGSITAKGIIENAILPSSSDLVVSPTANKTAVILSFRGKQFVWIINTIDLRANRVNGTGSATRIIGWSHDGKEIIIAFNVQLRRISID